MTASTPVASKPLSPLKAEAKNVQTPVKPQASAPVHRFTPSYATSTLEADDVATPKVSATPAPKVEITEPVIPVVHNESIASIDTIDIPKLDDLDNYNDVKEQVIDEPKKSIVDLTGDNFLAQFAVPTKKAVEPVAEEIEEEPDRKSVV